MKITKTKAFKVFKAPLIEANPVSVAILGIAQHWR
jgi:Na+-transporting NADH:ubiquinone oxidoreductase subunit NqrD